mmetsp:Transcript_147823/g.474517  ORF Transcript_147823/g.474517 Transcript_147823/m.474517 type:complete len:115 (+) Transcript_147823:110-454(+)
MEISPRETVNMACRIVCLAFQRRQLASGGTGQGTLIFERLQIKEQTLMTECNCQLEVFIDTNLAYYGKCASFKVDGSRCHHAAIATKVNQTLKTQERISWRTREEALPGEILNH